MIIYKITNLHNGCYYIGKTTRTLSERWYQHCKQVEYGSHTHFHRAIRKYGVDSFVLDVLEYVDGDLNRAEMGWIKKLDPYYNMTVGGDGGWIYDQTGNRWKVSDSSKMVKHFREGNHHTLQWRNAVVGGANYQCNYIISTPWGTFDTWKSATDQAKQLKKDGRRDVITDTNTLQKYCKENIMLNREGRRTFPEWRGKFTSDLGFSYKIKE